MTSFVYIIMCGHMITGSVNANAKTKAQISCALTAKWLNPIVQSLKCDISVVACNPAIILASCSASREPVDS